MNVFLIVQQSPRHHPVPAYSFWEYYFKQGLAEGGHRWCETAGADWAEGLTPMAPDERAAWKDRTWSATIHAIKAACPDFVLCYLFPNQVDTSALAEIRAQGIPCVNFFCDNVREFQQGIPSCFSAFDLHWVPEAAALAQYRKAGLPFLNAPMPVWIAPKWRELPAEESAELVFIGTRDVLREALLAEAVDKGLDLRLHGTGWAGTSDTGAHPGAKTPLSRLLKNQWHFVKRWGFGGYMVKRAYQRFRIPPPTWIPACLGEPLSNEAYLQVTREAQVTLGINRYPDFRHHPTAPDTYSRLRDIEAPMLGACYLTEMAPGLPELYELGSEIETYGSVQELCDKASFLRSNPALRAKLRRKGQQKALTQHSIPRTIDAISSRLGLATGARIG